MVIIIYSFQRALLNEIGICHIHSSVPLLRCPKHGWNRAREGVQGNGETIYYKLFPLIIIVSVHGRMCWHRQPYKEKMAMPISQMRKLSFRKLNKFVLSQPVNKWQNSTYIQTVGPWSPKSVAPSGPGVTRAWPLLGEVRTEANRPTSHPQPPGTQFSPGEQCFLKGTGGK